MGIFALFPVRSVKCRLRALAEMRLVAVPCVSNVHAPLRSLCDISTLFTAEMGRAFIPLERRIISCLLSELEKTSLSV